MECYVCGLNISSGKALFRQNEYGVKGIWACELHNKKPIDTHVKHITNIIENDNIEKNNESVH